MPRGKTKFQPMWLSEMDVHGEDIKTWCSRGRDEFEAYCNLCLCYFQIDNSGKYQILAHAKKNKHTQAWKLSKGQTKLHLALVPTAEGSLVSINASSTSRTSTIEIALNKVQQATRAEAIWCMKIAKSNYSFSSCSDLSDLFDMMFENHPVVKCMKLNEKKASYVITHGLAKYFEDDLKGELKQSTGTALFTLAFDETTTSQVKKQMDIYLRFWSPVKNEITIAYLTSVFLGHATALVMKDKLLNVLEGHGLPLDKLLMLSMDGPNVNKCLLKLLNEEIEKKCSSKLADVGTCSLHQVHTAFAEGLDALDIDIDEFAIDLFSFFKLSAARREDFKNIQDYMNASQHSLLRHVSSRWLSLESVVNRILEQYDVLCEYFLIYLPKCKTAKKLVECAKYRRICKCLKDPATKIYLVFVHSLTPTLSKYLNLFQTEGPLIHILFTKMNELLRSVLAMYLKGDYYGDKEGSSLKQLDLEDTKHFCSLKEIDIGITTKRLIAELPTSEQKIIFMNLRSSLEAIGKGLQLRLPLDNSLLRDLQVLHPLMRTVVNTEKAIARLIEGLKPLLFSDLQINNTAQEWKQYCMEVAIQKDWYIECEKEVNGVKEVKYRRIDQYWAKVLELVDVNGNSKYMHLALLVKCCLTLSHGNSDPERGFSINNAILSKERGSLGERTIIGLRIVKDAIRRHGGLIKDVPITGKMLLAVQNSHKLYKDYMEQEKKTKQMQILEKEQLEQKRKQAELNLKRKATYEDKLKKLNKDLEGLQKLDTAAAQELVKEGNKKLIEAIKQKDFLKASVASSMVETGTKKMEETLTKVAKLQDEIQHCNEKRRKL